jgi:heme/copper-type cytochrome/quinol oxidase subunit 3
MTTSVVQQVVPPLPISASGARSTGWWGVVILILNEATLFAALLASYLYLRFNSPVWPPAGIELPKPLLGFIGAIILIISSVFMHWAESGIRRGDRRRLQTSLLIAFILGAVFIAIQLYEYNYLGFLPRDNTYASIFFAITGLHGMHVLVGLAMNLFMQVRASRGYFNANRFLAVQAVVLYWHFVDVVWIVVFLTLYISPYL